MARLISLIICFISLQLAESSAQVKIRIFSNLSPESAVFTVSKGNYDADTFTGQNISLAEGESLIITKFKGKLGIKARNSTGFICDSIKFYGRSGNDLFSLRINTDSPVRQQYSGDLFCLPDMDNLLLINLSDIEQYIAGVVRSEGGTGKNIEYFKSQSVIARTYMYKYFDKHSSDAYNLCDNTHCQAYKGICTDPTITSAAFATHSLVILSPDSELVIAAFHSNCGGETASSEDVWLSSQPYLKKLTDPYCLSSRNATWEKVITLQEWEMFLANSGYLRPVDGPENFDFIQKSRLTDYKTGSFSMPLKSIRADMNLRSSFFSILTKGDTIIMKGKGYGHGVGMCQEGAMVMADKGFNYKQIIDFYYAGVIITDVKNAVIKSD